MRRGYAPGEFDEMIDAFPAWLKRRRGDQAVVSVGRGVFSISVRIQ